MALTTLVESQLLLSEEGWGEKGKLIFLFPRPAAVYIGLALYKRYFPLHMQGQV
jgi:hypothetical protein